MCTLANSEAPDEMSHNVAFHQTVCSSEKEIQFHLEIITCDSSIYAMDHPSLLYKTRRMNPLVHKGLINLLYTNGFFLLH